MATIALFPAGARAVTAHVYVDPYCCSFPPSVIVGSATDEPTRMVIQANGVEAGGVGATEVVITSEARPIEARGLCTNAGPQVAVCTSPTEPSAKPITTALFDLRGPSNKVAFAPGSSLLYQSYWTRDGPDVISTGPFGGSPIYNYGAVATDLGGGNDRIEFGPGPSDARPFALWLEEGNDTAIDMDSVPGDIHCGDGWDRVVTDGQNYETSDCERQVQR